MPSAVRFTLYPHGQQWYVRFSAGGRQHRKPVCALEAAGEDEARAKAAEIVRRAQHQVERASDRRQTQNPLVLFQDRLANRGIARQQNCARYEQRLIDFFTPERDITTLTRADVEDWRDWLLIQPLKNRGKDRKVEMHGTLSIKSVREHLCWLSSVFEYAGLPNPCKGVDRPETTHEEDTQNVEYFTQPEMAKLLAAASNYAFHNAFVFLAYTGTRANEMRGIRISDIDQSRKTVKVIGKGRGKKKKVRSLMLTGAAAPAWEALMREIKLRGVIAGTIFPQGETWIYKGVDRICRKALGRSGHPHMLRHTFVTMALFHWQPRWSIERVAKWGGWSDYSTLYKIYTHLMAEAPPSAWDFSEVAQVQNTAQK